MRLRGFKVKILLLSMWRTQFFSWIQSYYACNTYDDVLHHQYYIKIYLLSYYTYFITLYYYIIFYIISKFGDLFFTKKKKGSEKQGGQPTLTTFLVFLNLRKFLSHWRCSFHTFAIPGKKIHTIQYSFISLCRPAFLGIETNELLNVCLWELSSIS